MFSRSLSDDWTLRNDAKMTARWTPPQKGEGFFLLPLLGAIAAKITMAVKACVVAARVVTVLRPVVRGSVMAARAAKMAKVVRGTKGALRNVNNAAARAGQKRMAKSALDRLSAQLDVAESGLDIGRKIVRDSARDANKVLAKAGYKQRVNVAKFEKNLITPVKAIKLPSQLTSSSTLGKVKGGRGGRLSVGVTGKKNGNGGTRGRKNPPRNLPLSRPPTSPHNRLVSTTNVARTRGRRKEVSSSPFPPPRGRAVIAVTSPSVLPPPRPVRIGKMG